METLGPYELLSPIGQGGMAEVWLARRSMAGGPGKLVAIKRMAAGLASQEHYRDMFEAETRMSMTLSHSNIVQVFDYGAVHGDAYIVMELVDGVDLGSLIAYGASNPDAQGRGILPLPITTFVVGELLRALSYSHNLSISSESLGLIHRDVSPQNLLISKAGEVKLTDFGVARLVDENTSGAQPKGKLRYMAPEQMNGKGMDARVDLFAVGAILFELMTGRHYRDADAVDQLYGQILNPGPVVLPSDLPYELVSLTTDLLAPEAQDRVPTAAEARARLTAWSGFRDTRDELAQIVRDCRPEALSVPPTRSQSFSGTGPGVGFGSDSLPNAAAYAGHTQVRPSAGMHSGGQTLPNSIPEHTTLPDTTSASGPIDDGYLKARNRKTATVVAGFAALVGCAGILVLSPSIRAGIFGGAKEAPKSSEVAVLPSGVAPSALPKSGVAQAPSVAVPAGQAGSPLAIGKPKVAAKPSPRVQPGAAGAANPGGRPSVAAKPTTTPTAQPKAQAPKPAQPKPTAPAIDSSDSKPAATPGQATSEIPANETPRERRRRLYKERRAKRLAEQREKRKNRAKSPSAQPSTPPAPKGMASLRLKAHEFNFAYVKIAGKTLLIEPLGTMRVPAGRHQVYVRESTSDPWRSFGSIEVSPGESAVLRLRRSGSVRVSRSNP